MSTLLRSAVIAGVLAAPVASQAAAPTLGDVLKASGITESGYINATYNYNNRQVSTGTATTPATYGYNDGSYDSFTLNQVGLMLSMTPASGFGGVVDILGGSDAQAIPSDAGSDIVFKQAYAQYASGAFTIMGGRFATLAGSEVIAVTGNSNATRSLLFGIQPLTHTGARASFKAGAVSVTGGLVNSVGGGIPDNNPQKTLELQVAFASDALSLALTGYKGEEASGPASPPNQPTSPLLIDFVGTLQVTKAVSLGLNFDHQDLDDATTGTTETKVKRDGVALYANLQATDVLRAGIRAEYLKSKGTGTLFGGIPTDGGTVATDGTRKQKEVTLTGAYAAASNFDLVTDVRFDKDDADTSGTAGVQGPFNGKDSMVTVVVSGIYKF